MRTRTFGAGAVLSTSAMAGHTSITRRSCVAALLAAATSCVASRLPAPRAAVSSSFLWTEPYDQLSSEGAPAGGRLRIPVEDRADAGLIVWG